MGAALGYVVAHFEYSGSIFYWPYVVSYFLITFGVLLGKLRRGPSAALRTMFRRDVWLTKSSRTDAAVSLIYMLAFDAPTGAWQTGWFVATYQLLKGRVFAGAAAPWTWTLPVAVEAAIGAVLTLLAFDLATYVGHWLEHKVPVLWDIHAVHHSPTNLNMLSAYRQHPLDRVIRNGLGGVFTGAAMATLHLVLPHGTWGTMLFGTGAGTFLFLLTVHLQHSHVPVHYPMWLRRLLLSPHLHQIHHSTAERHRDKNFGGIFPYWDMVFGTYMDEEVVMGGLSFGLGDDDPYEDEILRCYWYPFYAMAMRVRGRARLRRDPPFGRTRGVPPLDLPY